MNEVWIALACDQFDGNNILGVTTTRDTAQALCDWDAGNRLLETWDVNPNELAFGDALEVWERRTHVASSEERFATRDGLNALDREDWDTLTRFLSLSPREQEVALLMARGLYRREIADALFITLATVRNYVSHIYAIYHLDALAKAGRTGGTARIELARRFMRLGAAINRAPEWKVGE